QVRDWTRTLRYGGPRRRARNPATAMSYLRTARPALLSWSSTYEHLREVTRDDVLAYLDTLRGEPRMRALVALRSLFTWAKRAGAIFRNPSARITAGKRPLIIWQPLS